MNLVLLVLVFLVLVVIGGVVLGGTALARSSKSTFAAANEVVPGTPTRAPAEWAGSHSTEARLHRRLRDAVAAMRANPALDDLAFTEPRMMVEAEALAVDDRLVAAAALPASQRGERIAAVGEAVEAIEAVVAEIVDASTATADTDGALAAVRTRLELVAQARNELSALESTSQLPDLRDSIQSEPASATDSETAPEPDAAQPETSQPDPGSAE